MIKAIALRELTKFLYATTLEVMQSVAFWIFSMRRMKK